MIGPPTIREPIRLDDESKGVRFYGDFSPHSVIISLGRPLVNRFTFHRKYIDDRFGSSVNINQFPRFSSRVPPKVCLNEIAGSHDLNVELQRVQPLVFKQMLSIQGDQCVSAAPSTMGMSFSGTAAANLRSSPRG